MTRSSLIAACATALAAGALAATAAAATPDSWRAGPNMAAFREFPAVAQLPDGRVLVVGGSGPGAGFAEIYSPATNAFSSTAPLHVSRSAPLAVTLSDGRVLVAGGDSPGTTAEVYDAGADTWTLTSNDMRDARFNPDVFLATEGGTATALPNGGALLAGGGTAAPTAHADLYVPSGSGAGSFQPAADMSTPRTGAAAAPLPGGKVLVVGGAVSSAPGSAALTSGEVYDAGSNTWTPVANAMGSPRLDPSAVPLPDGRVLIFAGLTAQSPLGAPSVTTVSEIYDPATNRFTPTNPMLASVLAPSVAGLADGRVVVAGGLGIFGFGPLAVGTQVYEPSINGWVEGAVPLSFTLGAAAALPDGDVLSTSLLSTSGLQASTQIYTPATVPGAPADVGAEPGNGSALVTWAPAADHARPIKAYTVRASNGSTVTTSDGRTHATIAVPNGAPVTFTVTAINDVGAGPASAPSAAVTPAASGTRDTTAPRIKVSGLKRKLKLKSFLEGVTATVTASEPASLSVDLLARARRITIARRYNIVLASKNYARATRRRIRVKPSRKLVGRTNAFDVRVRITATDAAGNQRTTSKTIKVSR